MQNGILVKLYSNNRAVRMSALGQKQTSTPVLIDVRFSNRPVGVKRFQTIHDCGVDVTCGLALFFGIGT